LYLMRGMSSVWKPEAMWKSVRRDELGARPEAVFSAEAAAMTPN